MFAWKKDKLLGGRLERVFFTLFAAISQVSTCHLCALRGHHGAMALIGDTKQATGEGKSGPVETKLTGPAAMTLVQWSTSLHTRNAVGKGGCGLDSNCFCLYEQLLMAAN